MKLYMKCAAILCCSLTAACVSSDIQFQQAEQATEAACAYKQNDSTLSNLRENGFFNNDPTPMMMASNARVSATEKAEFERYFQVREGCRNAVMALVSLYGPEYVTAKRQTMSATDRAISDPLANRISWGEFHKEAAAIVSNEEQIFAAFDEAVRGR